MLTYASPARNLGFGNEIFLQIEDELFSLSLLSSLTLILAQIYVVLWSDIQKSVSVFWCEQLGENAYVILTL